MSLQPPNKRRRIEHVDNSIKFSLSPDAAFIVSTYVHVFLHVMGIITALFLIVSLIIFCRNEVESQYRIQLLEMEERAKECDYKYTSNNCGPYLKGEIWQQFCHEWDICRQTSSAYISKSKIASKVFGELINTFAEPLSLKSMVYNSKVL
ncbi:hypothetical protein BCV72DRAFT_226482 [Rhizopus microsporus var. microsporus]|uniref:Brl1/Brr6 domain-containing protein n=2 Tax=Rhizopus microsporus TaxID=58291 RepID=A0A2G4SGB3_RHIZD|nr:uncharacterized protein RHIMIDRAFT_273844 [Rhizopus microsporus ATCC 52813]ORE07528.1 hypothetical protein BCV72DRAFT_226482 [Rhizopus microsporus var. microsporus]PHZ07805.1 hypothetical protein RHIMIDRAFT_273844 [Rhizopus microsporus ATCC 52813]